MKIISDKKNKKVVICQGADVLNEALKIKKEIKALKNTSLFSAVWLNYLNNKEISNLNRKKVIVFQSSTEFGSYGSFLSDKLLNKGCNLIKFKTISIKNVPECGQSQEILIINFHLQKC